MNRYAKTFAVGAAGLAGAIAIGVGSAGASGPPPGMTMPPPCAPGQAPQIGPGGMPSCLPSGMPGGNGGNGGAVPPGMNMPGGTMPGGNGGAGGAGGNGGMMLPELPACAPGVLPSPAAPCKFDPAGLPECAEGVMPSPQAPCKPKGMGPQFDMAPPAEAMKKLLTLDVEVDGSGEDPGTFDVTLVAIKKGIAKAARAQLQDQLEGESFIINATKAKCFADKKSDPDAIADPVSCKVLSEETDDSATTLRATVVTRMKFDQATRQPTFTATKFIIRGKSKI
jgi:hypothetical protein